MISFNVKGRDYEAEVGSDGVFYTRVDDKQVSSDTLAGLKAKLSKMTVKVSIPYTRYASVGYRNAPGGIYEGEFTGKHSDGRRILAREEGKPCQFGHHEMSGFLVKLDDSQRAELTRLDQAVVTAKDRLAEFIKTYEIKGYVGELIDKAISDALSSDDTT